MSYQRTGRPPINRLAGILGVASVWTVDPTNLVRCTDGNFENMTGEGTKNVAAWTQAGQLDFDLLGVYSLLVRGKFRLRNNDAGGSKVNFYLYGSIDGATWVPTDPVKDQTALSITLTNQVADLFLNAFLRARYIRIQWFSAGNACIVSGAVWEIEALDFGLT